MATRVLVTGATGFTGRYVVKELCSKGFSVTCFVRANSNCEPLAMFPVDYALGDLDDSNSLQNALRGKDILVNIASLGFGHAPAIVEACQKSNIQRAVFFSTTAVLTTLAAPSKLVRTVAEKLIFESGIDYTIIRPTMIYGSSADRNMIRLIRFISRCSIVPVFGSGNSLLQPIYVADLANAVAAILDKENTKNKVYHLSGRYPLSYNEVVDTVAQGLGKNVVKIHLPVMLSLWAIKVVNLLPGLPHITKEQVYRLNENKDFSHEEATRDFAYNPLSFEEGIRIEIKEFLERDKSAK